MRDRRPSVCLTRRRLLRCVLMLVVGGMLGSVQRVRAQPPTLWGEEEQRLRVGLKLFPACLGAVDNLDAHLTPDGALRVLVVYSGSDAAAKLAVASLNGIGTIRDLTLDVTALPAGELDANRQQAVSAVFIASVGLGSTRLRRWSERYRALVFSPFDGDVAAGAVAGVYVADRILPHINLTQAQRAGIRFKPFFLQVARQHHD